MELERRLRALGWSPTGEMSGRNHNVWAHPDVPRRLYVPVYDLINDASALRMLGEAGE
jgi:hypothetical protein